MVADNREIKGLGGITRAQLVDYLKRKDEERLLKPEVVRELYDPEDKTLITETPPNMIIPKIRMRIVLAARDTTRTESLLAVWLKSYNEEMIGLRRQGRQELLAALQLLADAEESQGSVTLGR